MELGEYIMTQKQRYIRQIISGRSNLMMMMALTGINIILYALKTSISFPFSAFLPELSLLLGVLNYGETGSILILLLGTGGFVILAGIYIMCYIKTKTNTNWFKTALVLFAVDTIAYLYFMAPLMDITTIIDLLFHVWLLYYLVMAVDAGSKLKKLLIKEKKESIVIPEVELPDQYDI